MLGFLAHTLEQLDLALEHVLKGDANSARFAVMLTDNALELVLHQLARDERRARSASWKRDKVYEDAAVLEAALGRHFDAKLRFAKPRLPISDEEAGTIAICHDLRNDVYHIGLQHEAVLPAIAGLYFDRTVRVLERYKPDFLCYSPDMVPPERSRKYFGQEHFGFRACEGFQEGCGALAVLAGFDAKSFVDALADHFADVVEEQDSVIDIVATGGPRQMSRDQAVIETESSHIMFDPKTALEAKKRLKGKVALAGESVAELQSWLVENGALRYTRDPVPGWRKREVSLRWEKNPHKALKKYHDFILQTADIRELLLEACGHVEQWIDGQIEQMRLARK
ncbi:hypothetical protein [Aquicoccus sp. SU-CL01552]|uniref:hypothetical protein n=1 Tax=Aquicoccus sp. SU-CL01552 TaxID=3127656 RepID=UPI0031021908